MIHKGTFDWGRNTWKRLLLAAIVAAGQAAATTFSGVGAGDTTVNSAVLWTRTVEDATLTVQIATDTNFTNIVVTLNGTTSSARDHALKLSASGLTSSTRYFYRFLSDDGTTSGLGSFKTAPNPTDNVQVRFGFSGDADGQWRPYPSINQIADRDLDFFVFLGDTIYETASKGSPAVTDPFANPTQALADFRRKYLENISPVNANGQPSLEPMFTATGHYTLLDNHETGNKQFQSGGAPQGTPPGAGADATNTIFDVNTTGAYMNKTTGLLALIQAYSDYQPIRESILSAPADPRSDGTQLQYFSQQWGAHAIFINLDDRSYRDIRLKTASGADDTGARADNPNRTILGSTQLGWFLDQLSAAQQNGVTWKFVAVSSPIDILGGDGGKSWQGGYRAERNQILKYIADKGINHVVFLTTDDHQIRVNELTYVPDAQNPDVYQRVPGCFQILAGPIGAGGPDAVTDHSFANIKAIADSLATSQISAGIDPIGLDPAFPGLHDVFREFDADANTLRQPIDFYSPDTFNYVTLTVSPDGETLSVNLLGLNSYAANTFPEPGSIAPARSILGFQIDAATLISQAEVNVQGSGFTYSRMTKLFTGTVSVTNTTNRTIAGPILAVFSGLPTGVIITNSTQTISGSPALSVAGSLAPQQTVSFPVQVSDPNLSGFSYQLGFYSGL